MTHIALRAGSLALALIGGLVAVRIADVSVWLVPIAATGIWVILNGGARCVHALALHRVVRDEHPRAIAALRDAAALHAVAAGGSGFTCGDGGLPALEAAVLLGPGQGPPPAEIRRRVESALLDDVARSSPRARRALAEGLDRLQSAAGEALGSPTHVLAPVAGELLSLLGDSRRRPLAELRVRFDMGALAELRWPRGHDVRRSVTTPERPEEVIALRLMAAGHDRPALAVIERAPSTEFARRLRRLARCRVLLLDAADGDVAPPGGRQAVRDATEMLLLAGRRMPDLVPGSAFLAAYPGGAAALERQVGLTPLTVAELTQLVVEAPELERPVATVVARIVGWSVGATVTAIRKGTLSARTDDALRCHLRGLALVEERRLTEATAEFEAALALAPGFAQAAFALATVQHRSGRVAAGESVLRSLVDTRPRLAEPLLYLARYLSLVGERDRSREIYEAGVDRFPHSTPLRVAFAQELLAWGCGADALEQLEAARRHLPREPRLALLAGRTLATEGRLDEAAAALESAARRLTDGDQGEAWFWLMAVRRDQGDHRTAQRLARRLVRVLGVGQSSMLDDVAEYLEERHDYERAREASDRARRLRGE